MPFKIIQLSYGANPRYVEAYSTLFSGSGNIDYHKGKRQHARRFSTGLCDLCFQSDHVLKCVEHHPILMQFNEEIRHLVSVAKESR